MEEKLIKASNDFFENFAFKVRAVNQSFYEDVRHKRHRKGH